MNRDILESVDIRESIQIYRGLLRMNVMIIVDIAKILYTAHSDVDIRLIYREVSGVGWVQCWDGTWDIGDIRFCQGSVYFRVYFILYLAHLACLQREVSGSGVLAGGWNVGTVENIGYWWTSPTRGTTTHPFSRRADKKCRRQEMEL